MSTNSDPNFALTIGVPQETNTMEVHFGAATVTSGLLPGSVYRGIATQDCHISLINSASGVAATTHAPFFMKENAFFFSTDDEHTAISVIRRSADGILYVTRESSRKPWQK